MLQDQIPNMKSLIQFFDFQYLQGAEEIVKKCSAVRTKVDGKITLQNNVVRSSQFFCSSHSRLFVNLCAMSFNHSA